MNRFARHTVGAIALLAMSVVIALATASLTPVFAADVPARLATMPSSTRPLSTAPRTALPFARSERAQSVWASNACWSECGAYCAWGQTACLARDTQGVCIKLTDDCDRYCQRNCRSSGGPLLPLDF